MGLTLTSTLTEFWKPPGSSPPREIKAWNHVRSQSSRETKTTGKESDNSLSSQQVENKIINDSGGCVDREAPACSQEGETLAQSNGLIKYELQHLCLLQEVFI